MERILLSICQSLTKALLLDNQSGLKIFRMEFTKKRVILQAQTLTESKKIG